MAESLSLQDIVKQARALANLSAPCLIFPDELFGKPALEVVDTVVKLLLEKPLCCYSFPPKTIDSSRR